MKPLASRNLPIPLSAYDPGRGNPVEIQPTPGEDYPGKELLPKLFQLPSTVGAEVEVFSTSQPHGALDVYFDNRIGVIGGQRADISNYEYVFIVYAVIGNITKQIAQGRFADPEVYSVSDGLIVSARCNAQRFLVTCLCVRATSGQVALTGFAHDQSTGDPTFMSAPSGYVVDRKFKVPGASGTITRAQAQVSQAYGFNNSGVTVYVRIEDGTGSLAEVLVPDQENFSIWFPVPVFFQDEVTWTASLSPQGGVYSSAQVSIYTQFR